jgi:hypothetical protein
LIILYLPVAVVVVLTVLAGVAAAVYCKVLSR